MRMPLNEIEWLDKVKQNFSEEQHYKDMSRAEENNLYGQITHISGYQGYSGSITGRVEMAGEIYDPVSGQWFRS